MEGISPVPCERKTIDTNNKAELPVDIGFPISKIVTLMYLT
jgi:hypothetical protein